LEQSNLFKPSVGHGPVSMLACSVTP
jgi:hypothetical protein